MKKKVILICSILILVLLIIWFYINYGNLINNKDYSKNNAKILAQLQDDDFWDKKIKKIIDKEDYWQRISLYRH